MQNVMLDLETMSEKSNAVIVSIGAVKFDKNGVDVQDTFYCNVDLQSCLDKGLSVSAATIQWWLKQDYKASEAFMVDTLPLSKALTEFADWLPDECLLWGNGAAFDNVIIGNAYDKCGIERPWKFWNDRCYRTLKNLMKITEDKREGVYHNALDDAIHQAKHAAKLLYMLPSQ